MITLDLELVIHRPLDEVYEFITNMENMTLWAGGIIEAKQTTSGERGVGTLFRLTAKPPVGAPVISEYAITAFERNRIFAAKGEVGPIPFHETWVFEARGDETHIHPHIELQPQGLLKLLQPLLGVIFRKWITSDFSKLKRILEGGKTV